jgi:hypothetical protein
MMVRVSRRCRYPWIRTSNNEGFCRNRWVGKVANVGFQGKTFEEWGMGI